MNNLELEITNVAYCDLDRIAEYIAKDNKKAARNLLKHFDKIFKTLCKHPQIGIKRADFTYKNVMFYVVKKNYVVAYQILDTRLKILRVLATYQDICNLL